MEPEDVVPFTLGIVAGSLMQSTVLAYKFDNADMEKGEIAFHLVGKPDVSYRLRMDWTDSPNE